VDFMTYNKSVLICHMLHVNKQYIFVILDAVLHITEDFD
jgi:hypothetical protein